MVNPDCQFVEIFAFQVAVGIFNFILQGVNKMLLNSADFTSYK